MDPAKITPSELSDLKHIRDLLHLFHHRNKNQHRRSIWWRHFSVFRRQIDLLVKEVSSLHEIPSTHVARARKKAQDVVVSRRIGQRLEFWQEATVPKWQLAFSQLTADGRFAVLGLVLLGLLAQLCHMTGITARFEELGRLEVEKVLQAFSKEDWGLDTALPVSRTEVAVEDRGEVIHRDVDKQLPAAIALPSEGSLRADVLVTSKKASIDKPRKKKRKRGDAIDDLFAGLD